MGVITAEPVLGLQTLLTCHGKFGQLVPYSLFPGLINDDGRQIRFREIAIIVGGFLFPLAERDPPVRIPAPGFLDDHTATAQNLFLTGNFEFDGFLHARERGNILDFGLYAEFGVSPGAKADIGFGAQGTFLHVAIAYIQILQNLL
ncbi:MAG: hypothetical protein BWY09_01842 [Candidatus Hydrogenedentes bacterium ADurb.Bin179]|nr:MAG: hypothetical protein BWY09_01842 [Candidatus Hydrogenedentes bacterium ADurb.Bin179]